MSDKNKPTPEEMGDQLDRDIKDTVHNWAENPEEGKLEERIDEKLRRTIAGWVGAEENDDWKTIGTKTDANTRKAIAKWVGAEEGADWGTISSRMEHRTRQGVARLVKAQKAEEEEASWSASARRSSATCAAGSVRWWGPIKKPTGRPSATR
jgi:hypothetical protein